MGHQLSKRTLFIVFGILLAGLVGPNSTAYADDEDVIGYSSTLFAFPLGPPCVAQTAIGRTPTEAAEGAVDLYNALMNGCFGPCHNPVDLISIDEPTLSYSIRSQCTGNYFTGGIHEIRNPKQPVCDGPNVGDPCNIALGATVEEQTDWTAPDSRSRLNFTRVYNSASQNIYTSAIGSNWQSNYDVRATRYDDHYTSADVKGFGTVQFWRYGGQVLTFNYDAGTDAWLSDSDIPERLIELTDPAGNHVGWRLFSGKDDSEEVYDSTGKPIFLRDAEGFERTLGYDASEQLTSVTDFRGRILSFSYNGSGQLQTVTTPNNEAITFQYDGNGMLEYVHYPVSGGSVARRYIYGSAYGSYLLTGIEDELGARFTTWDYNSDGAVTLNTHGDISSAIDRTSIQYNADGSVTVTNALGVERTYTWVDQLGIRKFGGADVPCDGCGDGRTATRDYDANGYPSSTTDFNGATTEYTFNERGLEVQRIEAKTTTGSSSPAERRKIQTDWHLTFRVPTERRIYNVNDALEAKTRWVYNSRGQTVARCEIDIAVGGADTYTCGSSANAPVGVRQSLYAYCEQNNVINGKCPLVGLLISGNGPRSTTDAGMGGFNDSVGYIYYDADDATCATNGVCAHRKGDLWKAANGLGQTTEYVSYDKNGRVTRIKDVNGTYTDFTYHPRGWLTDRIVRASASGTPSAGDAIMHIDYDAVGNVVKVTKPDGDFLAYAYDDAHRLMSITDALGNSIDYCPGGVGSADCLDAAGNRVIEEIRSAGPPTQLKHRLRREYDQLGRLRKILNAASQPMLDATNGYDANGNLVSSADGLGIATQQTYDGLDRLIRTLQNYNGVDPATSDTTTEYAYDTRDNLRQVTDPDTLPTLYDYDSLNNLTGLHSPDTGYTSYGYDKAGNRTSQTDARIVTSAYTYDALNRLMAVTYPTSSLNVTYAYDQANGTTGCATSYPVGRLTTMTDGSGSTTYCYDRRGNVTMKKQVTGGVSFTTAYTWTPGDRLASMTYPSGVIATYTRDVVGRVASLSVKINGINGTLISNASYYPFGPLNVLTFGNGRTLTKTYDQNYAIDQITSSAAGGLTLDFGVDVMGNITNASQTIGPPTPDRTYGYDPLYRLMTVQSGASHLEDYTYNATGDRLTASLNGGPATTYSYTPNTHQLANLGGTSRSYDQNGNTKTGVASGFTFNYDDKNRLASAVKGLSTYGYQTNGRGQRVRKAQTGGSATTTEYVYDESGQLLGEYGSTGATQAEYVYLDNLPIAVIKSGVVSYIETDHLGTPRQVVDPATNTVLWKWDLLAGAFGTNAPVAPAYTLNPRFPGQYYDAETGLNFNNARYYEPGVGRYDQSDPIGLAGGISTYGYVLGNPLKFVDPFGLWVKFCSRQLTDRNSPPTGRWNPFRHDYLNVSGTFLGFTPVNDWTFWGPGKISGDEQDNGRCSMVCKDNKFDQYVLKAAKDIGAPTYCPLGEVGLPGGEAAMGAGAINCHTWVALVLEKAKQDYLANEKCPECFK